MKRPRVKPSVVTAPLRPRIPVPPEERVVGADGWPIKPGLVVRRKAFESARYGSVAGIAGKVVRVYRREPGGPVLVDFVGDAKTAAVGLFTTSPERLVASAARIETEYVK